MLQNSSLIRTRINNNLLNVSHESYYVREILALGLQSTLPANKCRGIRSKRTPEQDLYIITGCINRYDLLRICVLLGTSRNIEARDTIMEAINFRFKNITANDYKYIQEILHNKNVTIKDRINDFLCGNLKGYNTLYCDLAALENC